MKVQMRNQSTTVMSQRELWAAPGDDSMARLGKQGYDLSRARDGSSYHVSNYTTS